MDWTARWMIASQRELTTTVRMTFLMAFFMVPVVWQPFYRKSTLDDQNVHRENVDVLVGFLTSLGDRHLDVVVCALFV
jgi:hypothetical protein